MSRPVFVFILVLIVYSAACIGGCRRAGKWLVREDMPSHADAIVLLMGNFPERVLQAVDLYHEGRADSLIIVYESMGAYEILEERGASVVRTTTQARDAAVALGIPSERIIILPGDARSTLDEAIALREYLRMNWVTDTIILVSSPSHMRRSYLIFRAILRDLEQQIYIGSVPSTYSGFNPEKWWRRREDVQSVLSEYVKLLSFIFVEKGKSVNN
ncbi:MAG TPA: YdcF family protein [Bacteroidales bacterium]|nr:YdcF family protein [Bacteroidales bacterium]